MEDGEVQSLGTVNDDEFTEFDHDVSEAPLYVPPDDDSEQPRARGRTRIEEQWTRVLSINH